MIMLTVLFIAVLTRLAISVPVDNAATSDVYDGGCGLNLGRHNLDIGLPKHCAGVYCTKKPTKHIEEIEQAIRKEELNNNEDTYVEWKEAINVTGADDCPVKASYQKPYFVREFLKHNWIRVVQSKNFQQRIWIGKCLTKSQSCFKPAINIGDTETVCVQEYASVELLVFDDKLIISKKEFSFPSYCSCKTNYEYKYYDYK